MASDDTGKDLYGRPEPPATEAPKPKVIVHVDEVPNVTIDLTAVRKELRDDVEAACRKGILDAQAQGMTFSEPVVVAVSENKACANAEIGAGGEAGAGGKVSVVFDPDCFPGIAEDGIARETTHELNHEWRTQKGHQPRTLGDYLVSEGLAVTAEEAQHDRAGYTRYQSDAFRKEFIKRAKENIDMPFHPPTDFNPWFFGPEGAPHFGGYSLGRDIVRSYLAANNLSDKKAHDLDSKKIIGDWLSGKFELLSEKDVAPEKAKPQAAKVSRNP